MDQTVSAADFFGSGVHVPPPNEPYTGGPPRIHLVAVALGAYDACSSFYDDDDGSLMLASNLTGSDHVDRNAEYYRPFSIGDINPSGNFIHVFDEKALTVVMSEFDTISDFVRYLSQRASYLRSDINIFASSEAELITYYLHNEDEDGNHIFPKYESGKNIDSIFIPNGSYDSFRKLPQYKAKRKADAISYNWDKLIKVFSDHVVAGTSISLDGSDVKPDEAERGLRVMALENRTVRRILAGAFLDALRKAEELKQDRFVRVVKPNSGTANTKICYIFLIMAFKADHIVSRGYDKYREMRAFHLRAYAEAIFNKHDDVEGVLGIAIDASPRVTGRTGSSEDLMFIVKGERTQEEIDHWEKVRQELEILIDGQLMHGRSTTQEFPLPLSQSYYNHSGPESEVGNRRQRRIAKSQARHRRKRQKM